MRRKVVSGMMSAAILVAATIVSLAFAELAVRSVDGFRLTSWRLIRATPAASAPQTARIDNTEEYARAIPLAPGMVAEWFGLSPEPVKPNPQSPVLAEAVRRFAESGAAQDGFRLFNWRYASDLLCEDVRFRSFPGFLFVFDGLESSDRPGFRFPRDVTTPSGLITNQFGWRGPPIELAKPARTIRIAFVGASTTINAHDYPFSYPELTGFWLTKWAEASRLDVRIEIINAGREGLGSSDIAAVVRDELLPLQPDLVVYYEGSNQFTPDGTVRFTNLFRFKREILAWLQRRADHSALARRMATFVRLTSAGLSNTDYQSAWPADLDENNPPIRRAYMPSNLSTIMRDLDETEARLRLVGSELVPSSFFWLVYDGMQLNPRRDRAIADYLQTQFYPYRYAELARVAAFQNRLLQKFAEARGLPFIDVAGRMPRDPNLFDDPIHATYPGVRLHAWIAAQDLAVVLARRIAAGRLPRPARAAPAAHPAFAGGERTLTYACQRPPGGGRIRPAVAEFAKGLAVPP